MIDYRKRWEREMVEKAKQRDSLEKKLEFIKRYAIDNWVNEYLWKGLEERMEKELKNE